MSKENNVENRAYKVYMTLKDKKPFAYQIGDKLYYIGCAICRECTAEEKSIYEEYRKEFENLCVKVVQASKTLQDESFEKIGIIMEKLLTFDGSVYCDAIKKEEYKKMRKLLQNITEAELKELENQMKDFYISLDYADGNAYKYLHKNRKEK